MLTFHSGRYSVSKLVSFLANALFQECEPTDEPETRHVRIRTPRSEVDMLVILHREAGKTKYDMHVTLGTSEEIDAEFPTTKKKEREPCQSTDP